MLLSAQRDWLRQWIYPELPDRFHPTQATLEALIPKQQAYSSQYYKYVESMQCNATVGESAHQLSYLPIAKNVRGIATAIRDNLAKGTRTILASGNEIEETFLSSTRGDSWSPWLWSRIPRAQLHLLGTGQDDVNLSWPTYFVGLDKGPRERADTAVPKPDWRHGRDRERRMLEMATCTRFAFRLNRHMQGVVADYKAKMGWPPDEPVLGIHLRSGDESLSQNKRSRNCYRLEDYLARADEMCQRYQIRSLYLSSESAIDIEWAKALRPDYRILSLDHDRSIYPKITDASPYVEDKVLEDPTDIEALANSAIADLYFLQSCKAFIGTLNSEFSVLGLLLCIGANGFTVPYFNLSPRRKMAAHQGRLGLYLSPSLS